jgi:5-methylcytosine-specific restriction endonuclease McrA
MASYIPVDLRNQVRVCDRNRYCYCKTSEALSGIRMAFDHIHPRSKGGETCFENVWSYAHFWCMEGKEGRAYPAG